ncbi:uncharacterized protein C8R40DRAFT_357117 [Lentinula edodes]|uniref:uncharacterized protein n=1 Tax=Lentinula edodes TaxID=5353 RepID=UPI001E8EE66D|nr:uncharacterized protein C8R40DRAFT_357117 [Lentinula edodes]KAH7873779.1 hypothetical protein C8R40DRAFT_357117 [Lentinula edodes]
MASSPGKMSNLPLTGTSIYKTPFTELFLSNPFLLSSFLRFVPWKVFLTLSQTCRAWRSFIEFTSTHPRSDSPQKWIASRNIVLARYVDGFGKVLREAGPENLALREDLGLELCWEDLVLLIISQQTPLHTYPTHALTVLSSGTMPETSRMPRHSRDLLKTAHLARLTLAHSRFVLVLQGIAHSSANPPPQESDILIPLSADTHLADSSYRSHNRASSAGSVRELVFPAPLAPGHTAIQTSRSMTDLNVVDAASSSGKHSAHSRAATDSPSALRKDRPGFKRNSSNPSNKQWNGYPSFPASASTPSISISPTDSISKSNKRFSVASLRGKASRLPPPPVAESRALREYSSSFGWRRGLNDAKGKWEATIPSYRSTSAISKNIFRESAGYSSEVDDDELFSTPRRRFAGSDMGVSGSESSFSEGTSSTTSSSTSASNSTSATSISALDSPPPLSQKEQLSGAEVLAINRGRLRSAATDARGMRPRSIGHSQPLSVLNSDFSPPSSAQSRASTLSPGKPRASTSRRGQLRSIPSAIGLPGVDLGHNNPHALNLATSRIRAPVLRVFVPSSDMTLPYTTDSSDEGGVSRCEDELIRAGLWEHLSVGDVVCNLGYVPPSVSPSQSSSDAVWLIFNGYQLIPFTFGAQDSRGILPVYTTPEPNYPGQEAWALPSWGYYEHLFQQELSLRGSPGGRKAGMEQKMNMNTRILISKIPVSPLQLDVMHQPSLISVAMNIPSPHSPGGIVVVKKWVWTLRVWVGLSSRSNFVSSLTDNGLETEVGPGWEGEWILEGDGTKEGRESLLSCLRRDQQRMDKMEWELVRDRCGKGKVWLRAYVRFFDHGLFIDQHCASPIPE